MRTLQAVVQKILMHTASSQSAMLLKTISAQKGIVYETNKRITQPDQPKMISLCSEYRSLKLSL